MHEPNEFQSLHFRQIKRYKSEEGVEFEIDASRHLIKHLISKSASTPYPGLNVRSRRESGALENEFSGGPRAAVQRPSYDDTKLTLISAVKSQLLVFRDW
jgi:hypothetical protein